MFVRRCFLLLLVCLSSWKLMGEGHAQATPADTSQPSNAPQLSAFPPSAIVTIYQFDTHDTHGLVTVADLKGKGDKFEARNPPESGPLFALLRQSGRLLLTSTTPVNARYEIERSDCSERYAVSREGVVWTGTANYQLSKEDLKTFRSLVAKIEGSADTVNGVSQWTEDKNGVPRRLKETIIVTFIVDEHGKTKNVHVVKSCGNKALDDAACDAVLEQRFQPTMLDGVPQATRYMHAFVVGDQ